MNLNSSIFCAYDPLGKSAPLHIQTVGKNENNTLSIRPVWIIGDLETLHLWLNSPDKKTNWNLDLQQQTVYQRYKNFLLSDQAQSLMVEQDDQLLIQFDLLPWFGSDREQPEAKGQLNLDLYFLFQEQFRRPELFKNGLECIVAYAFSFPEVGFIYLQLLMPDISLSAILIDMGFKLIPAEFSGRLASQSYRLLRNR